jgi:SagB-type dehydrogenase family enzyme
MQFQKYITVNGFEPDGLEECIAFHDTTKIKPYSSVKTFLRSSQYVDSARGVEETSRNYRNYNSPYEDISDAKLPSTGFDDINSARGSTRQFDGAAAFDRHKILSALKACCDTRVGITPHSETAELGFRGYASAGGLFPVDIYVLERVGSTYILRYLNPRTLRLYELKTFGAEHHAMLRRALCDGKHDLIDTAQGVVILSAVWERSIVKYGRQGYRFSVMELGIVAHHLSLCLTALGVDNLHWGGGFEDLVGEFVGIDPRSEAVGHLLWYGIGDA